MDLGLRGWMMLLFPVLSFSISISIFFFLFFVFRFMLACIAH
jgi:hypothetical protein